MRICLSILLSSALSPLMAQVNGYASISAIAGNVLTVSSRNETYGSFGPGEFLVLMQMQDNVIGANTGNNSSFGDLSGIQQAGLYEVREIASVSRSGGTLTSITLVSAPSIGYSLGANGSVQAITFELLGSGGDFTTTANISAVPWDGSKGGVVAIEVAGTLTLAHNITANAAGFRGGGRDQTSSGACNVTTFRSAKTNSFAYKGEGIYKVTNSTYEAAKGKILNGGGGGNEHNGGGGGGGNYTSGGLSGPGWSCGAGHAGGMGGVGLSGHISASRVFMGGGGGGGEGNNSVSTDGGAGGGIILIKAAELRTVGTCSGRVISANGATAGNAGNDGAGGGGAGGSIVLDVGAFSFTSGCSPIIRANGGNGGIVNNGGLHAGGGGGGQGVVIFSSIIPLSNVTIQTQNGIGGCNNNANPCISQAASGTGSDQVGILGPSSGPLPIELISFQAIPVRQRVDLFWSTATEINNAYFTVERSSDLETWQVVDQLPGAGNSMEVLNYRTVDDAPLPLSSYYRLRQTDHDGTTTTSNTVAVHIAERDALLTAYPNPASDEITLVYDGSNSMADIEVHDELGRSVFTVAHSTTGRAVINVASLPTGVYTVVLTINGVQDRTRIVVHH